MWAALDLTRLDDSFTDWVTLAALAVAQERQATTGVAGDYLTALGVSALGPAPLDPEQFVTSMRVTGPVAVKAAMDRGLVAAGQSGLAQSAAAAVKHALNAGRSTVMASTVADPRAEGWQRVATGCDWCLMLADRGAVYTEATADFLSHDGCLCVAEIVLKD